MPNIIQEILNISTILPKDVVDILLIAFVIYRLFILIRGTRAVQMLVGLTFLFVLYFFSLWANLQSVSWVLENFWRISVIGIIILFQPEIRKALATVGQNPFFRGYSNIEQAKLIDRLVRSVSALAEKRTGALIALERNVNLQNYVEIGTKLDAVISKELIMTIFFMNSPLHDGAVIIQDGRISGAGAFLPLTLKTTLEQTIGTRHRAAIGLTEETDAVVVIVSEENGFISISMGGNLEMDIDSVRLKSILKDVFEPEENSGRRKGILRFIGSRKQTART